MYINYQSTTFTLIQQASDSPINNGILKPEKDAHQILIVVFEVYLGTCNVSQAVSVLTLACLLNISEFGATGPVFTAQANNRRVFRGGRFL